MIKENKVQITWGICICLGIVLGVVFKKLAIGMALGIIAGLLLDFRNK